MRVYICGTQKIKMEVGARAYRTGNVAPPLHICQLSTYT